MTVLEHKKMQQQEHLATKEKRGHLEREKARDNVDPESADQPK